MQFTRSKYSYALVLLAAGLACAEPSGVNLPGAKGTKTTKTSTSSGTSTGSGGTTQETTEGPSSSGGSAETQESTTKGEGGSKATTTKATTSSKGGSTGISRTTTKASGGSENTDSSEPTSTGGAGEETTTTPVTTGSCESSTKQLDVAVTWNKSGSSGTTTVTPAAGATVAVKDMGVKFCFTISSKLTPAALSINYGSISAANSSPHVVSSAKITLEDGPDGSSCLVIDVAGVPAVSSVSMDASTKMELQWMFNYSVVGSSLPDPSKPAQWIVSVGSDIAGCGDVPLQ